MKLIQINKFTWLDYFFLILIVFAIGLRFARFEQTYDWIADNTRDFLVAKHIVEYHDFKWIAPWAAGSHNYLANSVFYYYFLALLYYFSFGQVFYYQLLFAIVSTAIILIFAYLFAKLLFADKSRRYGSVLLFCLMPTLNLYGRSVFQPYLLAPFLMMSFYYFLAAFKKKSLKQLNFALIFYFIALNLHYAALILLPWIIGMSIYLQYKLGVKQKNQSRLQRFLLCQLNYPNLLILVAMLFLLVNQLMLKGIDRGVTYFFTFLNKIFITNSALYFNSLSLNLNSFFRGLTRSGEFNFAEILLALSIFLIFILFIFKKKTFFSLSLSLIFILLPIVFLVTHDDLSLPENYFLVFYLAAPFFWLSVLHSLNKKWSLLLLISLLLSFFLLSIKQQAVLRSFSNQELIDKYRWSAKMISIDAELNLVNQSDFFIFVIDDQLDWSSPAYWLYLEERLKLPLVETSPYKYNLVSLKRSSKNIYLICDNPRVSWNQGKEDWCLEYFNSNNKLAKHTVIAENKDQNLSIYRLLLHSAVSNVGVYTLAVR